MYDLSFIQRFESKINYNGTEQIGGSKCWIWIASKNSWGYGVFSIKHLPVLAHRLSYCIHNNIELSSLSTDQVIRHICNNPICVNPYHLALGTHADNVADKVRSGRSRFLVNKKGDNHGNTKLSSLQRKEIINRYTTSQITTSELAREYNVSQALISLVLKVGTGKSFIQRRGRNQNNGK